MSQGVGLLGAWEHAKSVMTLCFFLGLILYVLDRTLGVRVYRFIYNLVHGDNHKMPEEVRRGFLFGQSSRRMVFVVSAIEAWYVLKLIGAYGILGLDYFSEMFVWIMLPFALPLGFYLAGPWAYRMIGYFNPFIHKVDELNRSQIPVDLTALKGFAGKMWGMFGKSAPAPQAPIAPKPTPAAAPEPAAPKATLQDALDSYRRRR